MVKGKQVCTSLCLLSESMGKIIHFSGIWRYRISVSSDLFDICVYKFGTWKLQPITFKNSISEYWYLLCCIISIKRIWSCIFNWAKTFTSSQHTTIYAPWARSRRHVCYSQLHRLNTNKFTTR